MMHWSSMEEDFFPPFSQNECFPQLCDGVSLKYDCRRGLYIVAMRDIPCGEVVCLDTGKVVNLDSCLCCYCLSKLPENHRNRYCNSCVDQEELFGPFEQPFMDKLKDLGMFRLAIHLVLSYSSEEIRTCLKAGDLRRADVFDILAMRSDSLAAVLSLKTDLYPVDLSSTDELVKDLVNRLDEHPHWRKIPRGNRLDAFKTILRLTSSRLMSNAHSIYFIDSLESHSEVIHSKSTTPSGVGLFPAASWFNHSCRANSNSFFHGNKLVFVSMGIRKGEEVCDSYGVSFFKQTREERKDFLAGRGFTCECSVCVTDDSIDDMLEPIIKHPELILQSLPNVEDYRQYRNALPAGHKIIETIAEMYVGSIGGNDPKQRLFLYGEILKCQRHRGLHFSPDQIRIHLNCVLASYDIMARSAKKKQKCLVNMQVHLFAALVRMQTFYGKFYPAYDATKLVTDELIEIKETGVSGSFAAAVDQLRSALSLLKPALPTLE